MGGQVSGDGGGDPDDAIGFRVKKTAHRGKANADGRDLASQMLREQRVLRHDNPGWPAGKEICRQRHGVVMGRQQEARSATPDITRQAPCRGEELPEKDHKRPRKHQDIFRLENPVEKTERLEIMSSIEFHQGHSLGDSGLHGIRLGRRNDDVDSKSLPFQKSGEANHNSFGSPRPQRGEDNGYPFSFHPLRPLLSET